MAIALACPITSLTSSGPLPETQGLNGEVVTEKGDPIKGAVCTLTSTHAGILPQQGLSQTTSQNGGFNFPGLIPATYDLVCAAVGYSPVEQKDLQVSEEPTPFIQIALPTETIVKQQVEVHEKISTISTGASTQPSRLSAPQLQSLPLAQQKFKAALPLVPGVVRTPDGRISIKGSAESQGMLLVDSADTVDPVTGSFSIDVPLDAVESLDVYKSAYNAQYGRFSGGLTTIETKPPSGQWHYEVNDFLPTPRIRSGKLVGIADDEPRLSFTGPLWSNHLNFSESFTYDLNKQPVRGLAWPNNEIKTEGFTSFTSFQYIFGPNHLFTLNSNFFPLRHEFADINALIPQSASSNYGQRGFALAGTDRYLLTSGAVATTLFQFTKFDSYAHGQGPLDMLVTPNGYGGNYFNSWTRTSNQQELAETYELPHKEWRGKHDLRIGADYVHRSYDGVSDSRPIQILRADGTLAERIDFSGPANLSVEDSEWAGFIQDHWIFNEHLALDGGLRYSGQAIGAYDAIAPRMGMAYSPGTSTKTVVRGGIGVFYDRLPLLAGDFINNPTRAVSYFDSQGVLLGTPVTYENVYLRTDEKGRAVSTKAHHLSSTPYNLTWNMEIDRELGPRVLTRISYLSSRTYDVFIINPQTLTSANSVLLLTNTGASRYHEFESTVRIHASERSDFNISYIYSLTRGDLNTLGRVYVPFEQPVIRPNVFGALDSNVPNRVVAWGQFKIPWAVTATPLVDVHTGFPYSNFDVLQNYSGPANSQRFPTFFALDLKLSKEFNVPLMDWLKSHRFRVALAIYNITNHSNPLGVYSNITSPFFGHFVGFQHRLFDVQFDIVY